MKKQLLAFVSRLEKLNLGVDGTGVNKICVFVVCIVIAFWYVLLLACFCCVFLRCYVFYSVCVVLCVCVCVFPGWA